MKKYRIMTDGNLFKVQKRFLVFFWKDEMTPENFENKETGSIRYFKKEQEAKDYIRRQQISTFYVVK